MKILQQLLTLSAILFACCAPAVAAEEAPSSANLKAGVGIVDITPKEPIKLMGMPVAKPASEVKTRLYVRALVLSAGGTKAAIVTLDTLKYPVERAQEARAKIERTTGIQAENVIICASHTHSGPLWTYYQDQLATPIVEAVAQASRDLTPCTVGMAEGVADGISQCRRVIKDGRAWNRWQLPPGEDAQYPAEGPHDPAFDVLVLTGRDGRHKAVVYNFACHATANREPCISADFPGDVEVQVRKHLGYDVPVLFLTGACGDVNPVMGFRRDLLGEKIGGEIVRCLGQLEPVSKPSISVESREFQMPGRENPEFKEAEIARNWPAQLEHYRKAFDEMKKREKPSYLYFMTGIRIGNDFAIVTNGNELFCSIGLSIKERSPFQHTMVAEQTNGSHGYVPSAKAFAGGSYETWFGEHSHVTTKAGEIIERESLGILHRLNKAK